MGDSFLPQSSGIFKAWNTSPWLFSGTKRFLWPIVVFRSVKSQSGCSYPAGDVLKVLLQLLYFLPDLFSIALYVWPPHHILSCYWTSSVVYPAVHPENSSILQQQQQSEQSTCNSLGPSESTTSWVGTFLWGEIVRQLNLGPVFKTLIVPGKVHSLGWKSLMWKSTYTSSNIVSDIPFLLSQHHCVTR